MGMMTPQGWREDLADTPENRALYGGTTTTNAPISAPGPSTPSPAAPGPSAPSAAAPGPAAPSSSAPSPYAGLNTAQLNQLGLVDRFGMPVDAQTARTIAPAPGPTAVSTAPAPGPSAAASRTVARDGQSLAGQTPETQSAFAAAYGSNAAAEWVRQHEQGRESGFNPPQNVNTPSGAPPPGGTPPPPAQQGAGRSIVTPTGQVMTLPAGISDEDYAQLEADMKAWADSVKEAQKFNQGIEQGKLDLARASQAAQEAYQASYLLYLDRQIAQQAAEQALTRELERQKMELQRALAGQTAGLQREQMELQRRQLRPRRAAAVRYV